MANLDYLVTKLNVHGVSATPSLGGGLPDLVQLDVYAALGFGCLNPLACVIGLAVHTMDETTIKQARAASTLEVEKMFVKNDWSATRPFQARVNQWVRDGLVEPADAKYEKLVRGEKLKKQMAFLAIDELLDNHICKKCGGTGYINSKVHDRCHGTGKTRHSEAYNATMCFIEYDAWMKTWRHRYQQVLNHLSDNLNRFENHLQRHV